MDLSISTWKNLVLIVAIATENCFQPGVKELKFRINCKPEQPGDRNIGKVNNFTIDEPVTIIITMN